MTISWFQAAMLGIMSIMAASTIAAPGTTVGNYTLNRPLIASLFVGLIMGDVKGCIQIAIPMQVIYIALVTPAELSQLTCVQSPTSVFLLLMSLPRARVWRSTVLRQKVLPAPWAHS